LRGKNVVNGSKGPPNPEGGRFTTVGTIEKRKTLFWK